MPLIYPFSTGLRVVCEEGAVETSFRFYSVERPETILTRYSMKGLAEEPKMPNEDPTGLRAGTLLTVWRERPILDGSVLKQPVRGWKWSWQRKRHWSRVESEWYWQNEWIIQIALK